MIESIFNVIFSITDCWTRSKDPILNEYRSHARSAITFLFMSIFLLALVACISPSDENVQGIAMISYQLYRYFSLGLITLAAGFMLATVWTSIVFYLFLRENGFYM